MEKFKILSDVVGTWVAIMGAFAGGAFALIQYSDQVSSARVQETLKYVERLNKEPFQGAATRLEAFWLPKWNEVFNKHTEGEEAFSEYINNETRNNNLEIDTAQFLSFFDSLSACTCAKLCDASVARQFFGKQAYDFHGMSHPYLVSQRERLRDKSFGAGIESLAQNYKNEKQNTYCATNSVFH